MWREVELLGKQKSKNPKGRTRLSVPHPGICRQRLIPDHRVMFLLAATGLRRQDRRFLETAAVGSIRGESVVRLIREVNFVPFQGKQFAEPPAKKRDLRVLPGRKDRARKSKVVEVERWHEPKARYYSHLEPLNYDVTSCWGTLRKLKAVPPLWRRCL